MPVLIKFTRLTMDSVPVSLTQPLTLATAIRPKISETEITTMLEEADGPRVDIHALNEARPYVLICENQTAQADLDGKTVVVA